MSSQPLGAPADEVRKLQNFVDDGRRLRAQLRRAARALDKAAARGRAAPRAGLDAAAGRGKGWSLENRTLLVSLVVHYYPLDRLLGLPRELLEDAILSALDTRGLAAVASVSRAARRAAASDAAWRPQYARRFGTTEGSSSRQRSGSLDFGASLRESFRQRLGDPAPGDKVEIAWRGRFRLEGLEVYRGLAWWAAEVVAKRDASAHDNDRQARKYKVHYSSWDARWDEWVSRDQLRWPVAEGRTGLLTPGDDVEVWCSGSAVPGAWLRAQVTAAEGELYCVGDVASSGRLWVRRDRVRLVRRSQDKSVAKRPRGPCRMLFALARATSNAVRARLSNK